MGPGLDLDRRRGIGTVRRDVGVGDPDRIRSHKLCFWDGGTGPWSLGSGLGVFREPVRVYLRGQGPALYVVEGVGPNRVSFARREGQVSWCSRY